MKYYSLLFSILFAVVVFGQPSQVVSLTTDDGMSNGSALCVYKDRQGYVYIGTDVGVDRFDGERFVKIPFVGESDPEKSDVNCIVDESAETLLVGSQMGLLRLDTRRLVMERVFSRDINFEVTSAVKGSDGTVYVGTVNGLYAVNDNQVKPVDLFKNTKVKGRCVRDVAFSRGGKQGYVWLAMRKGVVCYDVATNSVKQYAWLYENTSRHIINQLAVSENGRVFVGTDDEGIYEFHPQTETFQNYYFKTWKIADMMCTPDNHLLVATGFHGAYDIDLGDNQIARNYSTNDIDGGIRTRFDSPYVFYRDPLGVDWIGYKFFGLDYTCYNRNTFHVYRVPGLFDSSMVNVRSFLRDGHTMLLGTRSGLYVIDEERHKLSIVGEEVLKSTLVSCLKRVSNLYVVGTISGGLHLLDVATLSDKTPEDIEHRLSGSSIYDLDVDEKGQLWVCSASGLMKYNMTTGDVHLYTSSNSPLPDNEVLNMTFDSQGNGWISTYKGGISFYNEELDLILPKTSMPSNAASIGAAITMEPLNDNRLLLLMLRDYPIIYDIHNDNFQALRLNMPLEHPRSQYYQELPNQSYIYGVKDGLYVSQHNTLRRFGYIDGLPNQEYQTHGYQLDADGTFWVATNGGLVYASLKDMLKTNFPHIAIVALDVITDHIYTESENSEVNYNKEIRLSRNKNEFAIKFTTLVYGNVKDLLYRYRLEGYEDEWHLAGKDHSVFYSSLPVGDYKLRIEAVGMPEVNVTMTVSVPFTYSAMIWTLIGLLFVSLIAHIVYCKVRKKEYFWERLLPKPEKYKTSRMDKREADRLAKALKGYMEEHKPYKRANLTMADLAKGIGCSSHTLSQLFSQYLNRNYYDYIAEYRVNEFKRLATDPKYNSLTISALSEKCGFASRNPFLTSFKKFTGMTPKDYVKSVQK